MLFQGQRATVRESERELEKDRKIEKKENREREREISIIRLRIAFRNPGFESLSRGLCGVFSRYKGRNKGLLQ